MSHTPGEWKRILTGIFTDEDNPQTIAYCDDHRNKSRRPPEEHIANARLIAAAPDLLEACKALIEASKLSEYVWDSDAAQQARAAIAKAKGN